MQLTLAQLCSTATAFIQGRTDFTASEASFYANIAYQEVATRIRYNAQEGLAVSSTTSGENRISLPSDFAYPIAVSNLSLFGDDNRKVLRSFSAERFDSESTTLGTPTAYALYATWMELWPSPDSAYSIQLRYGTKLATLVSSTDTPALDDRWHFAIACRTAALLAASRNDLESESVNQARYLGYIGSTPSDLALRQRDVKSMRVTFIR